MTASMTSSMTFIFALLFSALSLFATPQQPATASNPLGGNLTVVDGGTCSTFGSFLWQKLPSNASTTTINLSGTFSATVTVRESNNGGGSWSTAGTQSAAGTVSYATNGFTDICADVTTFVSGSVGVTISTGLNTGPAGPQGPSGGFPVITPVTVGSGGSITPTGTGFINLSAANTPVPASQVGPGFNVKNYGAKGDAQTTGGGGGCTFTSGQASFTCTNSSFSAATDIGKNIFCNSTNAGFSYFGNSLQTIISVQSSLGATVSTTAGASAAGSCVYGTIDDTAIAAAVTAAKAASKAVQSNGNIGIFTATPRVYFPAGGYLVCTLLANSMVNLGSTVDGFIVEGDGVDQTFLYPGAGNACPLGAGGAFINTVSGAANIQIQKLSIDGVDNTSSAVQGAIVVGGNAHLSDILIQRWGGNSANALGVQGSTNLLERIFTVNNIGPGFLCNACTGVWESGGSSNNASQANLVIQNVFGSNSALGFRVGKGVLIDECGSNTTGCTQVINSTDVWFEGPALFGTPNGFCLNIDATSFLHWQGGICGTFGTDTNTSGPRIALGGTLIASDLRSIATGTGKCITNNGTFLDNGGNTCESFFPISSGTSTGTAAVLTVTTQGAAPTTACSAGDSIVVTGAGLAGYSGYFQGAITASSATTISYTTNASTIGAIGAGGLAHCRGLLTYSGNLPKALLTNGQNTWIEGTAFATGVPFGNAKVQQAIAITGIRAVSQSAVATTCATPPVFAITDGTNAVTLTLTSGQTTWDSTVDAHSGINQTYKAGATLTGSFTAGVCATPPINPSVTYNWQAVLSN